MSEAVVQIERTSAGVATVWLNRPGQRNAINAAVVEALEVALDEIGRDRSIRVVVFRGRGGHFCAGAQLGPTEAQGDPGSAAPSFQSRLARLFDAVAALAKPTVAAVEGYSVAGGFELVLACDLAIASRSARLGDVHVRRGLVAGAGTLARLPRVVGPRRAKELMLTGRMLDADEAAGWGLVDAVDPAAFEDALAALCGRLADKSPFCLALTKQAIDRSLDADAATLKVIEALAVEAAHRSADGQEGVRAFIEKRAPRWIGR